MKRRVVVTGMGCVSPFGVGVETLWENLKAGNSGVRYLTLDKEKHLVHIGGQVPEFDSSKYVDSKDARRMDKFILCSVVAASLAIEDSGLDLQKEDLTRIGVIAGSAAGGLETIQKNQMKPPDFFLFHYVKFIFYTSQCFRDLTLPRDETVSHPRSISFSSTVKMVTYSPAPHC